MEDFRVQGDNAAAPFSLTLHRGEGMCLLAMNWRSGQPPDNFVGFALEFMAPGHTCYAPIYNRLAFTDASKIKDKSQLSSRLCPIQKFRWIHFPELAETKGVFTYKVTSVFMGPAGDLSYGEFQEAKVALERETYPGQLDIAFTRGFVSSQAFADRYGKTAAEVATLIPPNATIGANGLDFKSTNPKAQEAYAWMGFEARRAILELLDAAIADKTVPVRVVAYDLNEAEVVSRLEALGDRLKIIIDDSGAHGTSGSAENEVEKRLKASAGTDNVRRQHMGGLQHNKFIVVGGAINKAICGSTNYSWRGFFVQSNNAITLSGTDVVAFFEKAFEAYWSSASNVSTFDTAGLSVWRPLPLPAIDVKLTFSPHVAAHGVLKGVADDILTTRSSLLYSLAFLYETPGLIKDAIVSVTGTDRFVYGISDREVGGLDVTTPSGNTAVVAPGALSAHVPPPFSEEPTGGSGARMHHKFVVIDFDKPTARVYVGSYNFSSAADQANGENLLCITDRRVTTAYAVEALSLFDHYHFRSKSTAAAEQGAPLILAKPPAKGGEAWFVEDYVVPYKIKDRELFA